MANYPEIPKFLRFNNKDVTEFYNTLERWGSTLINELTNRDRQIDTKPTTNIYTVVTISNIKRIQWMIIGSALTTLTALFIKDLL